MKPAENKLEVAPSFSSESDQPKIEQNKIKTYPLGGKMHLIEIPETDVEEPKNIEDEIYYHGYLDRELVDKLLIGEVDGTFLVRKISTQIRTQYIISLKYAKVHHILIKFSNGYLYSADTFAFHTIHELIKFHLEFPMPFRVWSDQPGDIELYKDMRWGKAIDFRNKLRQKRGYTYAFLKTPMKVLEGHLRHQQFRLYHKLGEGQFGCVYGGNMETGVFEPSIKVAVKLLHGIHLKIGDRYNLLREAKIMSQLRHKHVVKIHGVVTGGDPIMIAMEFCDGGSLEDVLKKANPSFEHKMHYLLGAAHGMTYLHMEGVVHGDFASRNCLISQGTIKLADFGLAAMGDLSAKRTGGQLPICSMAPELLRSLTGNITCESDVFSFGAMMYEVFHQANTPFDEFVGSPKHKMIAISTGQLHLYLWKRPKDAPILLPSPPGFRPLKPGSIKLKKNYDYKTDELPENVAKVLEELFEDCRKLDPKKRASFLTTAGGTKDISSRLQSIVNDLGLLIPKDIASSFYPKPSQGILAKIWKFITGKSVE